MRIALGTIGVLMGLGTIGWSIVLIFLTFLGYAFEFELGSPDPLSWLPWAIAFGGSRSERRKIYGKGAARLLLGLPHLKSRT